MSNTQNAYFYVVWEFERKQFVIIKFSKCLCKCYMGVREKAACQCQIPKMFIFMLYGSLRESSLLVSSSQNFYVNVTLVSKRRQLIIIKFSKFLCEYYIFERRQFVISSQNVYVNVTWAFDRRHLFIIKLFTCMTILI
jgi:hypothetical protein